MMLPKAGCSEGKGAGAGRCPSIPSPNPPEGLNPPTSLRPPLKLSTLPPPPPFLIKNSSSWR